MTTRSCALATALCMCLPTTSLAQPAESAARGTTTAPNRAPPAATEAEPAAKKEDQARSCALGELCVGPLFSLGAINAFGLGAHARYGQHLGFGVDYQWMPTMKVLTTVGDVSASWSLVTLEGRWYPFGGAFWLGGGFAYQHFGAIGTGQMYGQEVTLSGALNIPAMKLGLGFMGHDGFVLGIDLALNVPLGARHVRFGQLSGPAASLASAETQASLQADIASAADKRVSMIPVIPQLNLLRVGYLF